MDLYNIPGDTGGTWRLNKFIEYQNKVPPVHTSFIVEYAKIRNLDKEDLIWLAWFESLTYCEITACLLLEVCGYNAYAEYEGCEDDWRESWLNWKPWLVFNSSRAYAKNMDWVVGLMIDFHKLVDSDPYEWVKSLQKSTPEETYNNVTKELCKIKYVGRFASDLFTEMLIVFYDAGMLDIPIKQPYELDWKNCSNLTSAMFNLMYMDEEANEFDRTGVIPEGFEVELNKRLRKIQKLVERRYPEQDTNIAVVQTKLCSFRNLFKGSRYGGYHHDRQLENLMYMYGAISGQDKFFRTMYDIRSAIYPENLLGEKHGWHGIRKERKKLWLKKGLTGVESVSTD